MEKRVKDFVQEFTNKFSELYVESFFVKYLSEYDKNSLLEAIQLANKETNVKITELFRKNLKDMGITAEEIKKYLK